jgi:hypothetical protein
LFPLLVTTLNDFEDKSLRERLVKKTLESQKNVIQLLRQFPKIQYILPAFPHPEISKTTTNNNITLFFINHSLNLIFIKLLVGV